MNAIPYINSNKDFVEVVDKMLLYIPENDELVTKIGRQVLIHGAQSLRMMKRFEKTSLLICQIGL